MFIDRYLKRKYIVNKFKHLILIKLILLVKNNKYLFQQ